MVPGQSCSTISMAGSSGRGCLCWSSSEPRGCELAASTLMVKINLTMCLVRLKLS